MSLNHKECRSMPRSGESERIDMVILDFLIKEDWPVTTEMVAKSAKINWNTAQLHLYKLVSEGLVRGKRVGRQNQWIVTEKGKKIRRA